MNILIKAYEDAKQAIYEHVGLEEDYVVCPIDDRTDSWWSLDEEQNEVYYADADNYEALFDGIGNYYQDDTYTQRFYKKWVYRGENFTLVMCDPHTDGMKWWRIFDNEKYVEFNEITKMY